VARHWPEARQPGETVLTANWSVLIRLANMTAHRATDERHSPTDPLLTVAQAGEYLGTGERFIRRLITERRIGYVKVGRYVRLERSTLDAFVDAGRVNSQR
jgi:excisionase family DNA binding protein